MTALHSRPIGRPDATSTWSSGDHVGRSSSILGTRVVRTEDPALLRGDGRYVCDLQLVNALHASFVRSPVAHGVLHGINVRDALQMPGVVGVWTAAELDVAPHHAFVPVHED